MCSLDTVLRVPTWLGLQFHLTFGVLFQDHSNFWQNLFVESMSLLTVGVHCQLLEAALKA